MELNRTPLRNIHSRNNHQVAPEGTENITPDLSLPSESPHTSAVTKYSG